MPLAISVEDKKSHHDLIHGQSRLKDVCYRNKILALVISLHANLFLPDGHDCPPTTWVANIRPWILLDRVP